MRALASRVVFPLMLVVAFGGALWGLESGVPAARILLTASIGSIIAVVILERVLPYRADWNRSSGDLVTDSAYLPTTVAVNGLIEPGVTVVGALIGGWLSRTLGSDLWPSTWPLVAQLVLACVVAELFDYWAHRVMHESELLWRLHATHHSAPRLYWLNATRSHPGEMLLRGTVGILPLAILGAGDSVIVLIALVNIVVGLFQHANIDFKLGPLSWIFSVGELHRWHHSQVIDEANRNYGNNFILWDAVFGTRFLPGDRAAPEALGIGGLDAFPRGYLAQLVAPIRWNEITRASEAALALRERT